MVLEHMYRTILPSALAVAGLLAQLGCEPSCEALLTCGEYPSVGGAGGSGGAGGAPGAGGHSGEGGDGGQGGAGPPVAVMVAVGGARTCAVLDDGRLYCWGLLDLGDTATFPKQVLLPRNVIAVAAGVSHTCAILDDGAVWCWGKNNAGQLGNGSTSLSEPPGAVALPAAAVVVAGGAAHTCAVWRAAPFTAGASMTAGSLAMAAPPPAPRLCWSLGLPPST